MYTTIEQTVSALKSGETTSLELVKKSIETFEADKKSEKPLNAFLEMYESAIGKAEVCDKEIQEARAKGSAALDALFETKPLLGLPFANKDNIKVADNFVCLLF